MSSFLDKIHVKTGVGRNNKFNLSCDHITTQDFFMLRPVYSRELMPGQSIHINAHKVFARLAPIEKPFFGNVRIVNRAFFVPYRTVFQFFNDFLADTTSVYNGEVIKVTFVPQISMYHLATVFANPSYGFATRTQGNEFDFESTLGTSPTSFNRYRLTNNGRVLMTIFNALGINVDFSIVSLDDADNFNISALPVLSFAKIIADWYCNPQYNTRRDAILKVINKNVQGGTISEDDLVTLCNNIIYSLYDNDYFTAAFDNPVAPNGSLLSSDVAISDVTNDFTGGSNITTNVSGSLRSSSSPSTYLPSTPSLRSGNLSSSYAPSNITQFLVDSLKALTDFVKRHQLVGSQTLDRYMAQFGIELEADKLNRSTYLGKTESQIDVADVMSTAETQTTQNSQTVLNPLGNYAAKGVAFQDGGGYNYTAKEFGMIIVVSTILPRISYTQGINRRNFHTDRFDFFNGDFDALGPQAIARAELFSDFKTSDQQDAKGAAVYTLKGIFGYTPRYSEYAVANDWLSGDFRHKSMSANLQSWHLFRMFSASTDDEVSEIKKHSEDFCVGNNSQYDRIFAFSSASADHFFVVHHFDIVSTMPKKPLFEQYDFDEGRSLMMNLGGTKLN